MPFSWDNFPYTNFHELNLDWFIKKFKEIFDEWESLYTTLTQWKDDTDADLAQWKEDTLSDMDTWERELLSALDEWKTDTGNDISDWEAGVISDLNDWKETFLAAYESLEDRVEAIVSDTEDMVENLAEPFSTSNNYKFGDYVIYNGILYMFVTTHSAGAWNSGHVKQAQAMTDITNVKNEFIYPYIPETDNYNYLEKEVYLLASNAIQAVSGSVGGEWGVRVTQPMYKLSLTPMFDSTQIDQTGIDPGDTYSLTWKRYKVSGEIKNNAPLMLVEQGTMHIGDYITFYNVELNDIIAFDGIAPNVGGVTYNYNYTRSSYYGGNENYLFGLCYVNKVDSLLQTANYSSSILLCDYKYILKKDVIDSDEYNVMNHTLENYNTKLAVPGYSSASGAKYGYKFGQDIDIFKYTPEFDGTYTGTYEVDVYKHNDSKADSLVGNNIYENVYLDYRKVFNYGDTIELYNIKNGDYIIINANHNLKVTYPNQPNNYPYLVRDYLLTTLAFYSGVAADGVEALGVSQATNTKDGIYGGDYIFINFNKNALYGKKLSLIGDSITEINYRAKINWSNYIKTWASCKIQNLGESGKGFLNDYSTTKYIDKISDIDSDCDIIGIACSFNDLDTTLNGNIDFSTSAGQTAGATVINAFFSALLTAYPNKPIICYCQNPWQYAKPGIATSDGYMKVVKECCAENGIPFYDELYYGSVMKPWISDNRNEYFKSDSTTNAGQVDNTHPNSKGHYAIAKYLIDKFKINI